EDPPGARESNGKSGSSATRTPCSTQRRNPGGRRFSRSPSSFSSRSGACLELLGLMGERGGRASPYTPPSPNPARRPPPALAHPRDNGQPRGGPCHSGRAVASGFLRGFVSGLPRYLRRDPPSPTLRATHCVDQSRTHRPDRDLVARLVVRRISFRRDERGP